MTVTDNPFVAILRGTEGKKIVIDEAEYDILKHMREMRTRERHCQLQIGYRDGKYTLFKVSAIGSFGTVDTK